MDTRSIDFSWYRRAQDSIAQDFLTNSKRIDSHIKGVYPTHFRYGEGAKLYDMENRPYIDFICGLGSSLLGYGNEYLCKEIERYLRDGFTHSFATYHEVEAAEKLKELIPFVEKVKFLKTGSEACNASLIMARAYTNRTLVYSDCYHGWGAEFTSLTPPANGCPYSPHIKKLPKEIPDLSNAAAVIVEPVVTDYSEERKAYLLKLREECNKHGCLLIFDEVITGLRFPKYCVSRHWKVIPDILLLGKAIGGGLPLSAVCGPKEIMDGEYFVSSTFAGEMFSLMAFKTLMHIMCKYADYSVDRLWNEGGYFIDEFNELSNIIAIEGYPTRGVFIGDPRNKALFFQEACKAGILFGPSFFFNFAHIEHAKPVLNICRDILMRIEKGYVHLEGEMPKSPFAERVRHGGS